MTTTTNTPVAIIGGGLSGLYTAYLLQQQGIQATIFEARDRLGGRIASLPSSKPTADIAPNVERYDLGPSWFWPDMHPLMDNLIEELGLTAFQQYQTGAHLFDRGRGNTPQRHELGIATSPISMRLSGGMLSLIEALAAKLPAESIQLNHQIADITQQPSGDISLTCNTPAGNTTITTQKLITALPLRLLSDTIRFSPALPDKLINECTNTLTWMAAHAKFVAVYDQPFWRQQGLSGSASSQTGPLVEIHDASAIEGKAALFGFVGVNAAARQTAGRETLIKVILSQLTALFGQQAEKPVDAFLVDWSQEKFTATEQDQIGANSHPMYGLATSASPLWDNNLIIAGTESSSNAGGYLEGALASALQATQQVTLHNRSKA
jgi:monoamine oxidase